MKHDCYMLYLVQTIECTLTGAVGYTGAAEQVIKSLWIPVVHLTFTKMCLLLSCFEWVHYYWIKYVTILLHLDWRCLSVFLVFFPEVLLLFSVLPSLFKLYSLWLSPRLWTFLKNPVPLPWVILKIILFIYWLSAAQWSELWTICSVFWHYNHSLITPDDTALPAYLSVTIIVFLHL